MTATNNKPNQTTNAPKAKKGKKPPSAERAAIELELKNAKSDQEKTVARGKLKVIKFREIVQPRVRKVINGLEQVERMANRAVYTWTDEEAAKIVDALDKQIAGIKLKFAGAKKEKVQFTL